MKALICCLNSKYVHASLAPWCLLSGVREYCTVPCEADVFESTINNDVNKIAESILSEKADVISFSCYIWNITKSLELCRILKSKANATIILGGPEVSYRAKAVLDDYAFIDFVLSGEGEESFPKFLEAIHNNLGYENVDGLSYRCGSKVASVPEKICVGTPPSPYSEDFFSNLLGRISYIETSRGCPYRCAFCLSGRCSPLRFFDIEKVKEDIIALASSGTKTVKFVDRTFNANSERANDILNFIISRRGKDFPENVCFHFEIAGDILTEKTFNILEHAPYGLFQLEIGMQTFNEATLKAINRKTNTEKLIKNIKRLVSFGNMHIHIDLIAGLTGEDIKSFENSFNIGYSLKAQMLQMGFLKLLYGAEMRENAEKYPCEFSSEPPYEVVSTPWLAKEEIHKLKKCEDALERLYNSGRFLLTLDYLLNECGYTPFKLFYDFGNAVDGGGMSLSDYALHIFDYFKSYCDEDILKEKIVCDLLSCSSALQIPKSLKTNSPLYKQLKKHFAENTSELIKIAVLEKSEKVYVVNQSRAKNLNGRYDGAFYDFSDFSFN